MDAAALQKLSRRDLQDLAKTHKVKANAKSAKIIQDLLKLHPQGVPLPREDTPEQPTPALPAQAPTPPASPPLAVTAAEAAPSAPSAQAQPTQNEAPAPADRTSATPEPPALSPQHAPRSPSPPAAPGASTQNEQNENNDKVEINSDTATEDLFPPRSPLRGIPIGTPLFSSNPDGFWLHSRARAPSPPSVAAAEPEPEPAQEVEVKREASDDSDDLPLRELSPLRENYRAPRPLFDPAGYTREALAGLLPQRPAPAQAAAESSLPPSSPPRRSESPPPAPRPSHQVLPTAPTAAPTAAALAIKAKLAALAKLNEEIEELKEVNDRKRELIRSSMALRERFETFLFRSQRVPAEWTEAEIWSGVLEKEVKCEEGEGWRELRPFEEYNGPQGGQLGPVQTQQREFFLKTKGNDPYAKFLPVQAPLPPYGKVFSRPKNDPRPQPTAAPLPASASHSIARPANPSPPSPPVFRGRLHDFDRTYVEPSPEEDDENEEDVLPTLLFSAPKSARASARASAPASTSRRQSFGEDDPFVDSSPCPPPTAGPSNRRAGSLQPQTGTARSRSAPAPIFAPTRPTFGDIHPVPVEREDTNPFLIGPSNGQPQRLVAEGQKRKRDDDGLVGTQGMMERTLDPRKRPRVSTSDAPPANPLPSRIVELARSLNIPVTTNYDEDTTAELDRQMENPIPYVMDGDFPEDDFADDDSFEN